MGRPIPPGSSRGQLADAVALLEPAGSRDDGALEHLEAIATLVDRQPGALVNARAGLAEHAAARVRSRLELGGMGAALQPDEWEWKPRRDRDWTIVSTLLAGSQAGACATPPNPGRSARGREPLCRGSTPELEPQRFGILGAGIRAALGLAYGHLHEFDRAYENLEMACAQLETSEISQHRLEAKKSMAAVLIWDEQFDDARRVLDEIEATREAHGHRGWFRFGTDMNRALFHLRFGALGDANDWADRVVNADDEDSRRSNFRMLRGGLASLLGLEAQADRDAIPGESDEEASEHESFREHAQHLRTLASAIERGDTAAVIEVSRRVEELRSTPASCLAQLLRADLAERVETALAERVEVVVGPETSWVEIAGGPPIDLRRSATTRRLLRGLIAGHEAAADESLGQALFEAAWPGEVWNLSARNRFHTAIHRLRDRVLGDLLVTREDGGYNLASACRVARTATAWSEREM